MQTHLCVCVCVCVCRDTHTLGRGAWEAAEEELAAATGAKETWEAEAGTESPASTCSFSIFWGDMVAAFINENDMYMYIHICKDTYIMNILFYMYSWYFICTYHGYSICTYISEFHQH